jgi:23S rRNA (cytosine1962-C5)-methyltransferase
MTVHDTPVEDLGAIVQRAIDRRATLRERLADEETDGYRLLHGAQEGAPGVTLDRYGTLALLQSFHAPVPEASVIAVGGVLDAQMPGLDLVYNDRSGPGSRVGNRLAGAQRAAAKQARVTREHGVRFHIRARHRGNDPWLFLDLRTTRRAVMDEARGASLLNLFAYTCGVGVAAAVAGARRVVNVDFAESSLTIGVDNAVLNGVHGRTTELVSDVFPVVRQLAGLRQPSVDRGRRLPPFPRLRAESFDLVCLDPPSRARSPFGVVDIARDYQALLKPALRVVSDRGALYCTNNLAQVDEEVWHGILRQCAVTHGRPIRTLDVIRPGDDFPSLDGRPPLKVARLTF